MLSRTPFRFAAVLTAALLPGIVQAAEGFTFQDRPGDHLDVMLDGKIVVRYMYAHDRSTPQRLHDTYKPYLHVFDADGKAPITKGPGGLFTHHRGIFAGWMKITFQGKNYDRWHMKGGDIVHQKFLLRKADRDHAVFTAVNHWLADAKTVILEEERTMTIRPAGKPGRLLIDVHLKLSAPNGDVRLDGDPEHSGVQFRPANEIAVKETVYVFPREKANPHKDVDYPWVGETFTLGRARHSVVLLNHPDNPKKTRFSAYRDYGRFGAFPAAAVANDHPLILKYRFLVADGSMPPVEYVQKAWDEYTQAKTATPTPKTTVIPVATPK